MRDDRIYGAALILGTVASLGTGMLHPTGGDLLRSPETFEHVARINVLAHALALAGVWLTAFGIVGLARRLGTQRPDVTAAAVAYGLAAVTLVLAAITDGLVSTRLAERLIGTDVAAERDLYKTLMTFCYYVASSLSRFYVTALAIAILLWSWAAWRTRFDRALPWVGAVIAIVALSAQLAGHMRMNIHDVILLVVGQGIWMVWAGVALLRRPSL